MIRGFRSFHPILLLLYYIFVITSFMLYQHPFFLLAGICLVLMINLILDGGEQLKKWMWMLIGMSSLILILTPLFNRRGNHILFYLFENQVTLESIIQGIMIAATLVGILATFLTFNLILTADKFLFLFARGFPQWAILIMISMRFVPLLIRRLKDIEQVQQLKGLSIKQGSVKRRAHNGMLFIQILLTSSLEESIQTADSIAARGYGLRKRSKYHPYTMKGTDWTVLTAMIVLFSLLVFGWWLGDGVLLLQPILESVWLSGREWFYFSIWLALIGIPMVTEGKEVLKWKYYLHKM
ncbi:energy-coupling factor transport system permease protein [Oceanobacillus limi]|uniref:Energy-coupling factor transport system permease protein n=1 Tax=Oceanobacillus limi TaxID=930131 RepID=A0A1H9YBA0_9BACI|nr:energy-coupling factor transporter transmembrane component T [Oceanobacillus limi]SES66234.1 energy-coupling factor transport system permease protein [Oceanobacillus limi]